MEPTTTIERSVEEPETFVRPNGKTYRPRTSGLTVRVWDNEHLDYTDQCYGVIVFGTHNRSRADALAIEAVRREWGGTFEIDNGTPTWMRLTPRAGEFVWVQDEVRGRPCVAFEAGER
jgi:hypothetical protein